MSRSRYAVGLCAVVAAAGTALVTPPASLATPSVGPARNPSGGATTVQTRAGGLTAPPVIRAAAKHDASPALRTLTPHKPNTSSVPPAHRVPKPETSGAAAKPRAQTRVQSGVTTDTMPSFAQNFEGVGNVNSVLPPDTEGDVGPNNYVQSINLSFAVWDKQGNLLYGPVPNTTLFQGFGGPCATVNGGDPVTMYDEQANRWFMSYLADAGGSVGYHECIAISQTPDPLGAWYRYDFLFSNTTLNDYPKFGTWPDAYYASANEFLGGNSFTGVTVQAYDRAAMLAGGDAQVVSFHIGDSSGIYGNLLPSNAEGGALGFNPPAGAPDPFLMFDDDAWGFSPTDRLLMWDFHVDWNNLDNSTFGVGANHAPNRFFQTAPFDSNLCNYARNCIPQPGTSVGLDALSDRLMQPADYRNFGDHQGIAVTQTVNVSGDPASPHAGIRWYRLNDDSSGWSLADQGTYAPDSDNRWMGSAALDASGDLTVGYSVSSASTSPSIRVAGRLADDPAGELAQGEQTMIAGGGAQTSAFSRWGDYSSMQVDPTDGCTFWYTSEYIPTTSDHDWHTRIGSFRFPSCTTGPHGALAGTVTDADTGKPISGAAISTSVASTTTDPQGQYSMTLPADTYDVTFSAFGYASKSVSGTQVIDGQTTTLDAALSAEPSVHVSGTVTDGSGHGWPLHTRIEITGRPGDPIYTVPETGHYEVDLPANATYHLTYTTDLPGYKVVRDTIDVGSTDVTHDVQIPVDATTCTAPGYHFVYGTPAVDESFEGTDPPAGWTVVDNQGNGEVWRFDDPGNRGNQTGGQGKFAIVDAGFYGFNQQQDTSLVTPTLDLTGAATPVVQFHNDYIPEAFFGPTQTGSVDMSTDGGQTWNTVWEHTNDFVNGPDLEEVAIPQAGGQRSVQFRFHFTNPSEFDFGWWQIDDVKVMNRSCGAIPGGLVLGKVTDFNTGNGLDQATITSGDKPDESATTTASGDPAIGEGYYWMFSTLTGAHPFTGSKDLVQYQRDTQTVNVAADDTTRADFALKAGRLAVDPNSITTSQLLGGTKTATVTVQNTGSAPAAVNVLERSGSLDVLSMRGSPLREIQLKNPANPGWLGGQQQSEQGPDVNAGPPKDPSWSTIAPYPTNILDNGTAVIDGKLYSVGGFDGNFSHPLTNKGYVYDPDTNTWAPIADMPVARESPGVAVLGGKLYVTGGWDMRSGTPIARTDVYDPTTDSWSTVSPNPDPTAAPGVAVLDGRMYVVGGCTNGSCSTTANVLSYDPTFDTWRSVASYPQKDSWESCGGINGTIYCAGGQDGAGLTFKTGFAYDPASDSWTGIARMPLDLWASAYGTANGLLVISSGITNQFSTITNQGVAYDPSSNSWTSIPNAQFPRERSGGACGFYKIGGAAAGLVLSDSEVLSGLDQCGSTAAPWLDESPKQFTLQPGQSRNVTVTLSATDNVGVRQPGAYIATITVDNNTPYAASRIDVTMNATSPPDWGQVAGTVSGTDCNGNTAPLPDAMVEADGHKPKWTFSLNTDADGKYQLWAPAAANPFTVTASKPGWASQIANVIVIAKKTQTVNFTLKPTTC